MFIWFARNIYGSSGKLWKIFDRTIISLTQLGSLFNVPLIYDRFLRRTDRTMISVTAYGSQLEEGRRSSR